MYPSVGALPIAAVKAATGVSTTPASPRPPRPAPPRPPRAAPRPPRAAAARPARAAPPPSPPAAEGLGPAPGGRLAAADGFAPGPPGEPAAAEGLGPAPAGRPSAVAGGAVAGAAAAGAVGVIAATTGVRSSSVDHRRIRILTGIPGSLTFADVAVRLSSPIAAVCFCACVGPNATDSPNIVTARPRLSLFIDSGWSLLLSPTTRPGVPVPRPSALPPAVSCRAR
jgi:hypothetical protein